MNKLEQMRAADNSEDALDEMDMKFDDQKNLSSIDKFKEEYFTMYSDIKTSIKEDW